MRNVLTAISAMTAAALLTAAPAHAASTLDVSWNTGCSKNTCFNDQGVFTQSWSSKDVGGPISIGQLLIDRGVLGSLDGEMFRLSFQIDGKEIGSWGSFVMGGIAGDELQFDGEAFTWNPEDGELTLVLEIFKPKEGAGGGFSSFARGAPSSPDEDGPGDQPEFPTYEGAGFEGFAGGAVPEPGAWALMIAGFGMAGAMLRRNTRIVASVQPQR